MLYKNSKSETKQNPHKNWTQRTFKKVGKADDTACFPTVSDEEILEVVGGFLNMRKWVSTAKFQPLCPTCNEPLEYSDLTYEGQNFQFYHCRECHANSNWGKNKPHSSLADFLKKLEGIPRAIEERAKEEAVEGLDELFG